MGKVLLIVIFILVFAITLAHSTPIPEIEIMPKNYFNVTTVEVPDTFLNRDHPPYQLVTTQTLLQIQQYVETVELGIHQDQHWYRLATSEWSHSSRERTHRQKDSRSPQNIQEPATMLLFGVGLAGVTMITQRKTKRPSNLAET
jgi:hypothetical protein